MNAPARLLPSSPHCSSSSTGAARVRGILSVTSAVTKSSPPNRARSCACGRKLAAPSKNATAYRILYRSSGLNGEPIAVSGGGAVSWRSGPRAGSVTSSPGRTRPRASSSGARRPCCPIFGHHRRHRGHARSRLRHCRHRLRRSRRTRHAPVSDRVQRGARGARHHARRAPASRCGRGSVLPFGVTSEGGHAALFTGEEAASYAPELKLVGVAAAAPPPISASWSGPTAAPSRQQPDDDDSVVSTSSTYHRQRRRSRGHAHLRGGGATCIERISELISLEEIVAAAATRIPQGRSDDDRALARHHGHELAWSSAGRCAVFIVQGTADEPVRPQMTQQFADRLCTAGACWR